MSRATLANALALAAALALGPAPRVQSRARHPDPAPGRSEDSPGRPSEFRRVARADAAAPPDKAVYEFGAGDFSYRVAANGNGRRTKGNRTRRFNLHLDSGYFIEGLRFAVYEGNLLLICELSDGESGGGLVTRLEQPSMRARWRQHVPAFNIGEPLREGQALYVTGIGFVGKLDLRTGDYLWRHDDLYTRQASAGPNSFNSFETPELSGDTVLFRDRPVYNLRKTLVVDKKSGKVLRVE